MTIHTGVFNALTGNPDKLNKQSFADVILRLFPNGSAPLFALTGRSGSTEAKGVSHGYFSKTMEFSKLTLNGAKLAADGTLTVDSTAGIVPGMVFHCFRTGENLRVTNVVDATNVAVSRGFGRVAAADLNDNEVLFNIGTAHEQGSARPDARRLKAQWIENYTQIFRNAWALTDTAKASMAEQGYSNIAENRGECAQFHSVDIETAMIWGQKSMDTTGSQPLHTTQGLIDAMKQYAPTHVQVAGATTNYSQMEDLVTPAFEYATDPSTAKDRVLFTGSAGNKVINEIGRKHANAQMTLNTSSMGMVFNTIRTYKGNLHVIEHPLFNALGDETSGMALVKDLSSVKLAYLPGRKTKPEEYGVGGATAQGTGIDAVGGSLTTECAVEDTNPYSGVLITGLTKGVA